MSETTIINSIIVAIAGVLSLVLQRRFSKKDSAGAALNNELRRIRRELNWQRAVINLMDQEVWESRRVMADKGLELKPRPEWPPRPDDVDEEAKK